MRYKYCFIITLATVIIAILSSPGKTQVKPHNSEETSTSSQQPTPEQPKILYFGMLEDSSPISSKSGTNDQSTFCGKLFSHLKKEYDSPEIQFQAIDLRYTERFAKEIRRDNSNITLAVECGPNTITTEREEKIKNIGGEFSSPFFMTGAKLLIRKDQLEYFEKINNSFNPVINNNILKIGVIKSKKQSETTTGGLIPTLYPKIAKVEPIDPKRNPRRNAVERLKSDNIDAYATDEILLKGLLKEDDDLRKSHVIFPALGKLSYEQYGVVIYDTDFQKGKTLPNTINSWIKNEGKKVTHDLILSHYNWSDRFLNWVYVAGINLRLYIRLFIIVILPIVLLATLGLISIYFWRKNFRYPSPELLDLMKDLKRYIENSIGQTEDLESLEAEQREALQELKNSLQNCLKDYPNQTLEEQKNGVNKIAQNIREKVKNNPELKEKIVKALKEAAKEAVDHPIINILVAFVEGWQEGGSPKSEA